MVLEVYRDRWYSSALSLYGNPTSNKCPAVLFVEPSMLEFNECNNFGYLNKYLYLDTIIISDGFDTKCLTIVG